MGGPHSAWLLIGPTGSGKSPLGEALGRRSGRVHFDFGAWLREAAQGSAASGLSPAERAYVQKLLRENALFAPRDAPLVRRVCRAFLRANEPAKGVVLNGIPRHPAQAEDLKGLFRVEAVVVLDCSALTVAARVGRRRAGEGEDHTGRDDDAPCDLERKLEIYLRETFPLVDYYRRQAIRVIERRIGENTRALELAAGLEEALIQGDPGRGKT